MTAIVKRRTSGPAYLQTLVRRTSAAISLLLGSDGASKQLRRILPLALILPLLAGYLLEYFENHWALDPDVGDLLLWLLYTSVLITLAFSVAASRRAAQQLRIAKELLRRNGKRFRTIVETSHEGIWTLDSSTNTTYVNQRMADLLGYEVAEMRGRPLSDFKFAEDMPETLERLERQRHSGEKQQVETRFRRKDGSALYALISTSPAWSEDGCHSGSMAMCMDIGERKRAEEKLRESNQMLAKAQEVGVIAAWSIDLLTGLETWTDRAFTIMGYQPGEVEPSVTNVYKRIYPEDQAAFLHGATQTLNGARNFDQEYRIVLPDGELRWIHSRAEIERDQAGTAIKLLGVKQDITERKQIERQLLESKQFLEKAQEIGRIGSWSLDLQTGKGYWSAEAYRLFGLPPFSVEPTFELFCSLLHPEDANSVQETIAASIENGNEHEIEYRVVWPDGSTHWMLDKTGILYDPATGKVSRMLGVTQDITDRKIAEEQRASLEIQLRQAQKMEAIGTLAGGIAHDFNNILAAIQGFGELVLEELPEGQVREDQQEVLVAAKRASELVRHILAFSRQTEARLSSVTVSAIVKEVVRLLRASLPATIDLQVDGLDNQAPVLADPVQLHQVVLNLCTNAAQAMEDEGSLALRISDYDSPGERDQFALEAGPYVVVTVEDTGSGIAPDILEKIFDPFFTTKGPGSGTGLGLSTVHGIVSSLGGRVVVRSEVGSGSCFIVFLPRARNVQLEAPGRREVLRGKGERILFVDDEPALARMNKELLLRLGYRPTAMTDSLAALDAFTLNPGQWDLIITDETMPGLTGSRLARAALTIRPDVPVILCTGFSSRVTAEVALRMGIRRFLLKPLSEAELAAAIRDVLDEGQGTDHAPLPEHRRLAEPVACSL